MKKNRETKMERSNRKEYREMKNQKRSIILEEAADGSYEIKRLVNLREWTFHNPQTKTIPLHIGDLLSSDQVDSMIGNQTITVTIL